MKYLYYLYQLFVAIPITILMTILTAVFVGVGTCHHSCFPVACQSGRP